MAATIQFSNDNTHKKDAIILPVVNGKIDGYAKKLNKGVFDKLKSLVDDKDSGFDGKAGEVVSFSSAEDSGYVWYVFVGMDENATALDLERAGGKCFVHLSGLKVRAVTLGGDMTPDRAAAIANGFYLRSYDFTKYKTKDKDKKKPMTLTVLSDEKAKAEKAFKAMKNVSDSVFAARNFVSEPPNELYPESYAEMIKKELKGTDVKITVFDEKKLEKMGAGAIMAVGKGSERKPRMVILEYDGRTSKSKNDKPLALVGKGVTFDTGGYSIKPRGSMETMKMDMGGSAAVIGAFKALASNKIKAHVVGAVALAENMVASNAYRVDDVLVSLSGQTIEVINTDAEGRLCLADALTYIQDEYKPKAVVDVATLTGACMAALGTKMAGVLSNNKHLEQAFWDSGVETGDDFWPLPINKDFDKQIDSPIADMRNLGTSPLGGASTAAVFLQRFITDDRPWAHLDIAGTAWQKEDSDLFPKGASGFGVRALYHWVMNY